MKFLQLAGAAALVAFYGAGPVFAAQDTPPVQIRALDPRSLGLATEIIDISFPPAERHAMMSRMSDAMMTQARTAATALNDGALDDDARRILDRFFERVRAVSDRQIAEGGPALFTAMARAYARMFTYSELVEIRIFAGTPAGRAFLQRSSDLLSDPDVARANTAYMAAAVQAMEPLRVQLMEDLRVYLQSHERHRDSPTGGTS